ncbi:tetratricopeptide repeat protein [Chlamydiota bacterium]
MKHKKHTYSIILTLIVFHLSSLPTLIEARRMRFKMPLFHKRNTYQQSTDYFARGKSLQEQMEFNKAIQAFRDALKLRKNLADAYFEIGTSFLKLEKPKKADHYFCQYLLYLPYSLSPRKNIEELHSLKYISKEAYKKASSYIGSFENDYNYHLEKGKLLRSLKRYEESIKSLKKARSYNKSQFEILHYLGKSYFENKEYHRAHPFLKVVTLYPDKTDSQDFRYLGDCYRLFKQFNKAINTYKKGQNLFLNEGSFGIGIALCYLEQQNTSSAIDALKRNIKIHPQYPTNYYLLGIVYQDSFGDKKKALQHLKTYNKIVPLRYRKGNHLIIDAEKRIKELEA